MKCQNIIYGFKVTTTTTTKTVSKAKLFKAAWTLHISEFDALK